MKAIELGATYQLAAAAGGITYDTFNEWRKADASFSDAINAAEGKAAEQWLRYIERAAKDGNWQAAAWKLERRYPHMYGRTVQETRNTHEHSGPSGQPIPIQYFDASAALAAAAGGSGEDREDA